MNRRFFPFIMIFAFCATIFTGCEEDKDKHIAVTSVTIERPATTTLIIGKTLLLTATIAPDNAADKTVTWTSGDETVATVNANGTVTAVAVGTATITASSSNGKTNSIDITVQAEAVPIKSVTLDQNELTLEVGETETLTATIAPDNATDKTVKWISDDTDVATVENGVVTVVGGGTATITVTTNDGKYTAICAVTVNPVVPKQITMITAKSGNVMIRMAGTGTFTINWGDGTDSETHTLNAYSTNWFNSAEYHYIHSYSNSYSRTITIICENITHLDCGDNELTSLDVSNNAELAVLYCLNNQLTSLDLSNNVKLIEFVCYENQLDSLDVSKNIKLTLLSCWDNPLGNLDVSKNTKLTVLWCMDNQLTNLDVSNNTKLRTLGCYNNQLDSLDVSNNTELKDFQCGNNKLTNLNMSKNTALTFLSCYHNKLDVAALNDLFNMLHDDDNVVYVDGKKYIYIGGNPGTTEAGLDISIATAQGWTVNW